MYETLDLGTLVFKTTDDVGAESDDEDLDITMIKPTTDAEISDIETEDEDIVMNSTAENESPYTSSDELGWPGNSPDTVVDLQSEDDDTKETPEKQSLPRPQTVLKLGSVERPDWADDSKFLHAKTLEDAYAIFEREGIVVLLDQFSAAECKEFVTSSATLFTDMSLGPIIEDYLAGMEGTQKIWTPSLVYDVSVNPPIAKYGCYKTVTNSAHQWSVRSSKQLYDTFKYFYNRMAGYDVGEMFTSIDGLIFHPDARTSEMFFVDSYYVDRATENIAANPNFFAKHDFINAQCSFSNSQSAFICCPRTHKYYDKFQQKNLIGRRGIVARELMKLARAQMDSCDDVAWNTLIWVPAGAVVLWDARLMVSSMVSPTVSNELVESMKSGRVTIGDTNEHLEPPQTVSSADEAKQLLHFDYGPAYDAGFFAGWRCMCTVSFTPKDFYNPNCADFMAKKLYKGYVCNRPVPRTSIVGGKCDPHRIPRKQAPYHRRNRRTNCIYNYVVRRQPYESIKHLIQYKSSHLMKLKMRRTNGQQTPTHITKKTLATK